MGAADAGGHRLERDRLRAGFDQQRLRGVERGVARLPGAEAAADGEGDGAGRVGVVASIGYLSGFAGPTAVGFLAQGVGLLPSFWLVVVAVLAAIAASGALRPLGAGASLRRPAT